MHRLKRKKRTVDEYMKAAAFLRLCDTILTYADITAYGALSDFTRQKIHNVIKELRSVRLAAEEDMFRDHPDLPKEYHGVFFIYPGARPKNSAGDTVADLMTRLENRELHLKPSQETEKQERVYFLCDTRQRCRDSENCILNGGTCHTTKNVRHAKSFMEWSREKPIFVEVEKKE